MSRTEFEIHRATREDAEVFLELIDAHASFEGMDPPDEAAKDRLTRDAFERDPPRYLAYLARHRGRDVGYAICYEAYSSFLALPTFYLEDIFVHSETRGMGFGGAVFQYLVEEAVRRGCGRMEWMVVDWNENAIGFYERRGAERLDEWHSYRLEGEALERLAVEGRAAHPS
ncbi:MAG: GNAT family N-acetyltransferase [Longimicrobiaceae bacterium]